MALSYERYKNREDITQDIKKEVLREFKESDYKGSDKLSVVLHRKIDNFVSYISLDELGIYLMWYNDEDKKTIDKSILPDEGTEKFNICLLYCLIEQDLYNDNEINKLQ